MVAVPNLVGKTEDEAAALLEEEKLGKQMIGEENSTQEKGRISSQDIPAGTKVEQYTTIKYHISKGQQEITIPELSDQTGVDAQQTLEDMGLTVTVQKEYSEADDSGWPLVEPGYVMSVSPEAGTSMTSGDSVTLTVSRGLDHGDTAQIPNVVGMTKNEALTALGKWVDIQVTEQQSAEVPAGQVISQDPSAVSEDDDVQAFMTRNEELKAPEYVHKRIEREIRKLNSMSINSSEYSVVRNYIDCLLSLPWFDCSEVNHDLKKAKEVLDRDHYGLTKVKDKILEYLAVQSRADRLHGPIICLMGPPGIGKTSLGKSIAEATGRKFVRVALGGVNDEAEIRGHRRTYIGALPGRIISNMAKVGVNNPLFLLDEIDKVVSSVHGDPSAALLEVLDPEQNSTFEDNYVEIDYDLSNVMFVTTANSYNIPGPLLDRMEIIDLSSYTEDEKFHIAKEHLFPKQLRLANVGEKEITIADDVLLHLIRYYTHEAGVRELERTLTEIIRKTIKDLMIENPKAKKLKATHVTIEDIHRMLGPEKYDFTSKLKESKVGIVNGLSWSTLGGDILQLEAVANEGKGKHQLTGKLGDVMKESISTAITVVRTLSKDLHLNQDFFETCDLHVHVPEGAVPKDGPSAGVGMVTAVVSALTGNPVRSDVAMTGEITLRGDVLPIGGLKEKLLAAMRGGIKTVMIPKENEKDLWDIPPVVQEKMTIKPVSRIEDVLKTALEHDPYTFMPTTSWLLKDKKQPSKGSRKKKEDSMNIVL